VLLNIGGIANITVIPAAAEPAQVIAFDTGPGNMVIDQLVSLATAGRERFDRGGRHAARGRIDESLLRRLLDDPFYRAKPPKTAGREQYGEEFVAPLISSGLPHDNLIATATALAALTIVQGIRLVGTDPDDLIVSGGGVHNPGILGLLAAYLPKTRVTTTAEFGIDPDAKEAIAFALLAWRTWRRLPSNLPSATGARHPVILGEVSPR
jgi:anhydro-N-acetylmuramic acid kinase